MRTICMALCASSLLCAAPVSAATIVQTANGGPAYVNKFDLAVGTLTSVSIAASYSVDAYFNYPFQAGTPVIQASGSYAANDTVKYDITGTYQSYQVNPDLIGITITGTAAGTTFSNLESYIGNGLVVLAPSLYFSSSYSINGVAIEMAANPFPARSRDRYTVTYDYIPAAVPEPATWLLMIAGFGMVGYVMRRRRTPFGTATFSGSACA
ncbi:PEPxxWA-CTERM sorting domain-containing protein [Sphingomonas sp. PAMC 26621]|uniref:PEPxxWA-CTERM sorting domain-containing protein n=1 Tax=Sphingomonas sp. PAMC 26621 TaxID=1112213 RepID=UPI0014793971|nr:PEPxxWA-CTERM sorting domain-containing protein [Sphingomonas sp. PAMC 26621]